MMLTVDQELNRQHTRKLTFISFTFCAVPTRFICSRFFSTHFQLNMILILFVRCLFFLVFLFQFEFSSSIHSSAGHLFRIKINKWDYEFAVCPLRDENTCEKFRHFFFCLHLKHHSFESDGECVIKACLLFLLRPKKWIIESNQDWDYFQCCWWFFRRELCSHCAQTFQTVFLQTNFFRSFILRANDFAVPCNATWNQNNKDTLMPSNKITFCTAERTHKNNL